MMTTLKPLTLALMLVFINYVSTTTYSLPSGDVWYVNSVLFNDWKKANDSCKIDMEGYSVEVDIELTKNEILELINITDKREIWLDAHKENTTKYVWKTSQKEVNHTLLPLNITQKPCEDQCCHLILEPNGEVHGVGCSDNSTFRKIVCQLIPVTSLSMRLDDAKNKIREVESQRENLNTSITNLQINYDLFRNKTVKDSEEMKSNLSKEVHLLENLNEQLTFLSKSSHDHQDQLNTLKRSRTILFILSTVCLVCVLGLMVMTRIVMKRQRAGYF